MWYQLALWGDIGAGNRDSTISPYHFPGLRRSPSSFWHSWPRRLSAWPLPPSYGLPEDPLTHMPNPRFWRWVLAVMFIPLALIAFWPSPVDQPVQGQLTEGLIFLHAHGIPAWFNYGFVEAAANVLLFVPLGVVASLAFVDKRWWQIGVFGFLVSSCIELGQFLFLHNRFASLQDVVTNTSGAVIGALLAVYTLKRLQARRVVAQGL